MYLSKYVAIYLFDKWRKCMLYNLSWKRDLQSQGLAILVSHELNMLFSPNKSRCAVLLWKHLFFRNKINELKE